VLDQNFLDTLQSTCHQARVDGTDLGEYKGRIATTVIDHFKNPCREVDACTNKHLLKIGQVAFFRNWRIALNDYGPPGDSERLQALKTVLGQLAKLSSAQNEAYSFRMANILLHYVLSMIADEKLCEMEDLCNRNDRLNWWVNNIDIDRK
jgi:hypothetical protein